MRALHFRASERSLKCSLSLAARRKPHSDSRRAMLHMPRMGGEQGRRLLGEDRVLGPQCTCIAGQRLPEGARRVARILRKVLVHHPTGTQVSERPGSVK